MRYAFDGNSPRVDPDAFVCAEATLVGDVEIGPEATVWPGAVLRGDSGPVRVGRNSHVEDNCVVHHSIIGEGVMVGHAAVVNAARVDDRILVGMNATINRDVHVHDRCVIAPNTVIPQGRDIPSDSLVMGVPATVAPFEETDHDIDEVLSTYSPERYGAMARKHDDLFGGE